MIMKHNFIFYFIITLHLATIKTNELLTREQQQILESTNIILRNNFHSVQPIVILNLAITNITVTTKTLYPYLTYSDDSFLLEAITKQIHEISLINILVYSDSEISQTVNENVFLHEGYIFLLGFYQQYDELEIEVSQHIENVKSSPSWNPRGKFIIILSFENTASQTSVALSLLKLLWEIANIINILIIMPNLDSTHQDFSEDTQLKMYLPNIYTWFPYDATGQNKVELLNDCLFDKGNVCNMFTPKVPQDFMGFPIKVGTVGPEPYVIVKSNTTTDGEKVEFQIGGLVVHLVNTIANKINITLLFNKPYIELGKDNFIKIMLDLINADIDIIAGIFPDVPLVYSFADPTVRYLYDSILWIVPCPKAIPRVQRVTNIFSSSAWMLMGIVFILSSVVVWYQANNKLLTKSESNTFKKLSQCILNVWAVLIGVSIPQLPKSTEIRMFFMIFVISSFAMCTVFQAFFTTFLIEPGYEDKFQTIEDVAKTNVSFGITTLTPIVMDIMDYHAHDIFKHNTLCPTFRYCVEEVMFHRTVLTLIPQYYPSYIAGERGIADESKVVCFLPEVFLTSGLSVGISKGSPLLQIFNKYLTRCNEGGILDEYWSRLKHGMNLKANTSGISSEEYFVFSMEHLSPIFAILFMGCCFSTLLLLAEIITKYCKKKHFKNQNMKVKTDN
ncbi:hypothetical protein L9F63_012969 [Diploptera punctata]|uniref:Ionotropic glutamate receptor C-terminal domain-containing protein n=1 Tax=Diploptera punctata TaxID=6984 RepID=A0AAD8ABZ3_DIPPU|nr:hypothetical protein L9F63_012969 [Diploptera punctata]